MLDVWLQCILNATLVQPVIVLAARHATYSQRLYAHDCCVTGQDLLHHSLLPAASEESHSGFVTSASPQHSLHLLGPQLAKPTQYCTCNLSASRHPAGSGAPCLRHDCLPRQHERPGLHHQDGPGSQAARGQPGCRGGPALQHRLTSWQVEC